MHSVARIQGLHKKNKNKNTKKTLSASSARGQYTPIMSLDDRKSPEARIHNVGDYDHNVPRGGGDDDDSSSFDNDPRYTKQDREDMFRLGKKQEFKVRGFSFSGFVLVLAHVVNMALTWFCDIESVWILGHFWIYDNLLGDVRVYSR